MSQDDFSHVEKSVEDFRAIMLRKLKARQHHGNRPAWLRTDIHILFRHLNDEVAELRSEIGAMTFSSCLGNSLPGGPDEECKQIDEGYRTRIEEECADVANMAMMIADCVKERHG